MSKRKTWINKQSKTYREVFIMKKLIVVALMSLVSFSSFAADGCVNADLKGVWKVFFTRPTHMNSSLVCTVRIDSPKSFHGHCGVSESPVSGSLSVSDLCYISGRIAGRDVSALMPMSDKQLVSGFGRTNNRGRVFLRMKKGHSLTH